MPALTYFTARLYYPAIVIDTAADAGGDVDIEPQTFGTSAAVTITPFIKHPPPPDWDHPTASDIRAATLTPTPAMLALAPLRARLDNGHLKVNASQEDVRLVAQTAVLGLPDGAILGYEFSFSHVTFNKAEQALPSFCVAAPTSDVILDLATDAHIQRR